MSLKIMLWETTILTLLRKLLGFLIIFPEKVCSRLNAYCIPSFSCRFSMMSRYWKEDPNERPKFEFIAKDLTSELENETVSRHLHNHSSISSPGVPGQIVQPASFIGKTFHGIPPLSLIGHVMIKLRLSLKEAVKNYGCIGTQQGDSCISSPVVTQTASSNTASRTNN